MKKYGWILILIIILGILTPISYPISIVESAISSCSASMSPQTVERGSSHTYEFNLTNNDSETIQWVRISRPSSAFSLSSASSSGWTAGLSSDNATFSAGGLDPGESHTFRVNASVSSGAAGTYSWSVIVSDNPSGSGQFTCDGNQNVSVTAPPGTAPAISNIKVSNISASSAIITWNTDIASKAKVQYGLNTGYGNETSWTSSFATSHSITLSNLSASTSYHYKVHNSSETNGTSSSGNNTFTTSAAQSKSSSSSSDGTGALAPKNDSSTETSPPEISLQTDFGKAFSEPPLIAGTASDNDKISSIDYSIDGGLNWLPVDSTEIKRNSSKSGQLVTFGFRPLNLEEGDYEILVRAIDVSSNVGFSPIYTLVIDIMPPQVGGITTSIGPHEVEVPDSGLIESMVGVDQKITLSAIGGPNSIQLLARETGSVHTPQTFALSLDPFTGLWSGIIRFENPGTYDLEIEALDGAGNTTHRKLSGFHVAPAASVAIGKNNTPLEGADITVFYFVPQNNSWVIWDSKPYGQENPQKTSENGQFELFLPPGKYYIDITHPKIRHTKSRIFELDKPTSINQPINVKASVGMSILGRRINLPLWATYEQSISRNFVAKSGNTDQLIGKQLQEFDLPDIDSSANLALDLGDKDKLLVLYNTWTPSSQDQINVLNKLHEAKDLPIVPIAIHESPNKVRAFFGIGNYGFNTLVDKNGATVDLLALNSYPTHVLIDKDGIIKKVRYGLLSEEEIETLLVGQK